MAYQLIDKLGRKRIIRRKVVEIKDLTDAEVWRLVQMPDYRGLSQGVKELKEKAWAEFIKRDIKLHWII